MEKPLTGKVEVKNLPKGKVKFFDKTRGFGFIEYRKQNLYFSVNDVKGKKTLESGDNVKFEIEKTEKGAKATRIEKV